MVLVSVLGRWLGRGVLGRGEVAEEKDGGFGVVPAEEKTVFVGMVERGGDGGRVRIWRERRVVRVGWTIQHSNFLSGSTYTLIL